MAVLLNADQSALVSSRKLPASQRPQYYNANTKATVTISEDFEAFLIMQGRPKNKDTVTWLQSASSYAIHDVDRDSLISYAIKNETDDATAAYNELAPITTQFNKFRQSYNMTGFEGVAEAGLLLDDLQKSMNEIMILGSRHQHRKTYASILYSNLSSRGMTADQFKEMNSWFESLTTY
jgi:hypothetical protein